MRQPHVSSVSVVIIAAIAAPTPEPIRKPRVVPQQAMAPINPRCPVGARSTRKPLNWYIRHRPISPWIMRKRISASGAAAQASHSREGGQSGKLGPP